MKQKPEYYKDKTLFISATNTNVGKTYASETFLRYFANAGLRVGYLKPCETGVIDFPLDGTKMLRLVKDLNFEFDFTINDVVPYQFSLPAAPWIAKNDTYIDVNFLKDQVTKLKEKCDVLIIEGAGGLMVPIQDNTLIIDLIRILECDETFLIAPSKLGCINDTLLSLEALKNRNINHSLYVNLYEDKDSFEKISKSYFDKCIKYEFLQKYLV